MPEQPMSIGEHVERLLESVPQPMAIAKAAKRKGKAAEPSTVAVIDAGVGADMTADELKRGMEKVGVKKASQLMKLINKGLAEPAIHTRTIDRVLDGLSVSGQTTRILRDFFANAPRATPSVAHGRLREARFARAAADAADMEKATAINLLENVWDTRHGSLAAFVLLYLNNKSKN